MSVDIYLIALERYTEYRPDWVNNGPRLDGERVWFGDWQYTEKPEELCALRGQQLTGALIARLEEWPREVCDERERAEVRTFLRSHRLWYVDFWAS